MLFDICWGFRYFRADLQPWKDGWRFWFYRIQFDGFHNSLHLGPLVLGWGDVIQPNISKEHSE